MQFHFRKIIALYCLILLVILTGVFSSFYQTQVLTPNEIELPRGFTKMPLAVDNPLMNETIELGHFLFYDPILSSDSNVSCAT